MYNIKQLAVFFRNKTSIVEPYAYHKYAEMLLIYG